MPPIAPPIPEKPEAVPISWPVNDNIDEVITYSDYGAAQPGELASSLHR